MANAEGQPRGSQIRRARRIHWRPTPACRRAGSATCCRRRLLRLRRRSHRAHHQLLPIWKTGCARCVPWARWTSLRCRRHRRSDQSQTPRPPPAVNDRDYHQDTRHDRRPTAPACPPAECPSCAPLHWLGFLAVVASYTLINLRGTAERGSAHCAATSCSGMLTGLIVAAAARAAPDRPRHQRHPPVLPPPARWSDAVANSTPPVRLPPAVTADRHPPRAGTVGTTVLPGLDLALPRLVAENQLKEVLEDARGDRHGVLLRYRRTSPAALWHHFLLRDNIAPAHTLMSPRATRLRPPRLAGGRLLCGGGPRPGRAICPRRRPAQETDGRIGAAHRHCAPSTAAPAPCSPYDYAPAERLEGVRQLLHLQRPYRPRAGKASSGEGPTAEFPALSTPRAGAGAAARRRPLPRPDPAPS